MNLVDNSLKNTFNSFKNRIQMEKPNNKYPYSLNKIALTPQITSTSRLSIIQSTPFIDYSRRDY